MKNVTISCSRCQTPFDKFKGEYDRQIRNGNFNFFCSKKCRNIHIKEVNGDQGRKTRLKNEYKYNLNPKRCIQCRVIIPYESRGNTYCSQKCGATYTQKDGGHGGNFEWTPNQKRDQSIRLKQNPIFHKNHCYGISIKCECPFCKITFEKVLSSKKIHCSQRCYFQSIKNG